MFPGHWILLLGLTAAPPGGSDVSSSREIWEVFPELSSDGRRLPPTAAAQVFPKRLQLSLEIDGRGVHIDLHQNQYLLPEFHTMTYYLPDGTEVRKRPEVVNCFYHGRAARGPWSSLSLCSGVRGTIILAPEQRFSIEPVPGDPSYRHTVRRIGTAQNRTCQTQDVPERSRRALLSLMDETQTQGSEQVMSEVKYVELVMVADNAEFRMLHQDVRSLHVRMVEIANRMDAFYRGLNIRVVLVMVEVWSQKDLISVTPDPAETLTRFLSWREKDLIHRVHHDNAQLLTGMTFSGSAVGMATMGSICSPERSGGVTSDHSVSVLLVASTMAHELGHNLGLNHDVGDGTCGLPRMGKQWIMGQPSGFMPGLEFSNCSVKDLRSSLRHGVGRCLFNVPSPGRLYGRPTCGNLLVEEGEECDCGLLQECSDPCCNASSCQLAAGAQCPSDGLCCERCKMKPPGSLCRPPLGECDLAEYCSGASAHCPADVYHQDGEPCGNGGAHCYQGQCRTLQTQCQHLWGPGSAPAPDSCFAKVNLRGDKYGNCGRATNGSYLRCAPRDVLCGSIQCVGGADRPLLGASTEIISVKVSVNGTEISCRGTYFNLGDDVWDTVLVKTGTVCGAGKVCVNQQCRDAAELRVPGCRSRCGGHGVCNSNGNCHCDPGYAPPQCEASGPGGSLDSGPVALEHAGGSVAGTVVLVLLLLCLMVLLVLCYLKRSSLQRKLSNVCSKSSKCQYRVTQTSSQPRPQRPPPPHWTQSTELQVMSVGDQSDHEDSARPDPPSKPLPPDPVPKRRQAAAQDRPPAPNRPLPVDPLPRRAQVSPLAKPPPPKRPLPLSPIQERPSYPEHMMAVPARLAPLPPYTGRSPHV